MATGIKFDDGSGGFATNCFPVRGIVRQTEDGAGAWLVAARAEQRRRFKAVICAKPRDYDTIRQERRRAEKEGTSIVPPAPYDEDEEEDTKILDGFFLMKHCCVDDPADLCSVNISGQCFTDVKEEDFALFDNVAYVNAAENYLPIESFTHFPIIRELEMPLNGLMGIGITFGEFLSLELLDLSYNNLMPGDILPLGLLPKLRVLHLTGNGLHTLPTELSRPHVERLNNVNRKIWRFPNLEILLLDDNKLSDLTSFAALAGLRNLKHLNMSKNEIHSVPQLMLVEGRHVTQEFESEEVRQLKSRHKSGRKSRAKSSRISHTNSARSSHRSHTNMEGVLEHTTSPRSKKEGRKKATKDKRDLPQDMAQSVLGPDVGTVLQANVQVSDIERVATDETTEHLLSKEISSSISDHTVANTANSTGALSNPPPPPTAVTSSETVGRDTDLYTNNPTDNLSQLSETSETAGKESPTKIESDSQNETQDAFQNETESASHNDPGNATINESGSVEQEGTLQDESETPVQTENSEENQADNASQNETENVPEDNISQQSETIIPIESETGPQEKDQLFVRQNESRPQSGGFQLTEHAESEEKLETDSEKQNVPVNEKNISPVQNETDTVSHNETETVPQNETVAQTETVTELNSSRQNNNDPADTDPYFNASNDNAVDEKYKSSDSLFDLDTALEELNLDKLDQKVEQDMEAENKKAVLLESRTSGFKDYDSDEPLPPPFPELRYLDVSHNLISEEEGLLAVAAWPVLSELLIHSNPLTMTTSGDPPLLKRFLRDRLGIHLQRKEPGPLQKPHIEVPQKKERRVKTKIYPVPRIDVDALLAIEAPTSRQYPPISEKSEPRSDSAGRLSSTPVQGTAFDPTKPLPPIPPTPDDDDEYDDDDDYESQASSARNQAEQDAFFMTAVGDQVDERSSRASSSRKSGGKKSRKTKIRREGEDAERYNGYEHLLDVNDDQIDDAIPLPKDISGNIRALQYALNHPLVFRENKVHLDRIQKPFKPLVKAEYGTGTTRKTRTQTVEEALATVKHRKTLEEQPLVKVLADKKKYRKHYNTANNLLHEVQRKYNIVRATSMRDNQQLQAIMQETLQTVQDASADSSQLIVS